MLSFTILEVQTKTAMGYEPRRMLIIKKKKDNNCWQKCGDKNTICGNVSSYSLLRN